MLRSALGAFAVIALMLLLLFRGVNLVTTAIATIPYVVVLFVAARIPTLWGTSSWRGRRAKAGFFVVFSFGLLGSRLLGEELFTDWRDKRVLVIQVFVLGVGLSGIAAGQLASLSLGDKHSNAPEQKTGPNIDSC